MSNVITFQLHIGDFLTGTLQMDATEVGAYIMLLLAHEQAGIEGLPDDDEILARIAKVTPHVWKNRLKKTVLEKKFVIHRGFWVNERVVDNYKKREKFLSNFEAKPLESNNADPELGGLLPSSFLHHEVKNFQLPLQDAARESGGVQAAGGSYRVLDYLDDDDLAEARAAAPGWDIQRLAEIFDEGLRDGSRPWPKHPRKPGGYFAGFCRSYTKGKRPS